MARDIQTSGHTLTLMRHMLENWLHLEGESAPPLQRIYCPECKRALNVDWSLASRGDYFCDGTEAVQYVARRSSRPSVMEIFAGKPLAQKKVEELARHIFAIRQTLEALETWLFVNTDPPLD